MGDKPLILFDLSRLYLTARAQSLQIDYKNLLEEVYYLLGLPAGSGDAVGFSTVPADASSRLQMFQARLRSVGYTLVTQQLKGGTSSASLRSIDHLQAMLRYASTHPYSELVLVTNSPAAIEETATLVYFSEDIPDSWRPLIQQRAVDFEDLSSPVVEKRIRVPLQGE